MSPQRRVLATSNRKPLLSGSAQETEIYVRYGTSLFAQFQTSERQSPMAALVVGKNLSQPVDLRAK
jgi:hypothetical protein